MTQQIQTKKLKEICDLRKGKKVNSSKNKTKNSVPYLLIDTLRGAKPKYFTEDKIYTEAIPSDILIVGDGANSGLVGTELKGAVGSTIIRIRLKDKSVNKDYIMYYLKSKFGILNKNVRGTGIPHLKTSEMLEMGIRIPPFEEQNQIVNEIEKQFTRLDASVKSLMIVLDKTELLRKSIFKSAFEGKLIK